MMIQRLWLTITMGICFVSIGCTDGLLQVSNGSGNSGSISPLSRVLIALGNVSGAYSMAPPEVFSSFTNTWSSTAAPPNGPTAEAAMVILGNGKVLLAGGGQDGSGNPTVSDGSTTRNYARLFDPATNTWSSTSPMNRDRNQFTLVKLLNGNAMAIGGCAGGCSGPSASGQMIGAVGPSIEIFDINTGTWTLKASMSIVRASRPGAAVFSSNGKVLVCGGGNGFATVYSSCELYDPLLNSWSATGAMSYTSSGFVPYRAMVALADGVSAMVIHNQGGGFGKTEKYSVASGTWSMTSNSPAVLRVGPLVPLSDGRVVLVGGGVSDGDFTPSTAVDIYSPVTNAWTAAGNLTKPRAYATAVLLKDGRILVIGGCSVTTTGGACTQFESTVEIYNPQTQASVAVGGISLSLLFPFAVLLP